MISLLRNLVLCVAVMSMAGCATAVAVVDVAGSAAVYTVKTTVNVLDAITPDIVNRK